MPGHSRHTHTGPRIGTQVPPDTSIIGGNKNAKARRGQGQPSKKGNIAIADLTKKTPGGVVVHHCWCGRSGHHPACRRLNHSAVCPKCGFYTPSRSDCMGCGRHLWAETMSQNHENKPMKNSNAARRAQNKKEKEDQQSMTFKKRDKSAKAQAGALNERAGRQPGGARAIANMARQPHDRSAGIRKRPIARGHLESRRRLAHALRRHTTRDSAFVEEMDVDSWTDEPPSRASRAGSFNSSSSELSEEDMRQLEQKASSACLELFLKLESLGFCMKMH